MGQSGTVRYAFAGKAPEISVVAKTADYTVVMPDDNGVFFTTRGAGGAVNFTLPAVTPDMAGYHCTMYAVADQNLTVTGPDEGLVVDNDATADSISFQTATEKIGNSFFCICDGTSWLAVPQHATEDATLTIASA